MNSDSLKKPVDLQGLSLALAKTKADYSAADAQIWDQIMMSDWEQDDGYENDYILNKPAVKAGDGENSIIVGQIENDSDYAVYTLTVSGDAKATEYSYTTEDTLPSSTSLKWYNFVYYEAGTSDTYKYAKITGIDTTNSVITLSNTLATTALTNATILLYYKTKNIALGQYSYSEGKGTIATATSSHAEGWNTFAKGIYSHAEGSHTLALSTNAHAEGGSAIAKALYSHAEGDATVAAGGYSHAEGKSTTASGQSSHAEGQTTTASGMYSHAEGNGTTASGVATHAEGSHSVASGEGAHVEGLYTIANHQGQHVFGEYNIADPSSAAADTHGNYIEIVGNGTAENARSNARTLDWSGNEVLAGKLTVGAAPTNEMDVATKGYVDSATSGITTNLAGLTDTTITSPSDGQVLTYDGTNQVWVNGESGGAYYVNITSSTVEGETVYTSDKTFAEILTAIEAGKMVMIVYNNYYYRYDWVAVGSSSSTITFSSKTILVGGQGGISYRVFVLSSTGSIKHYSNYLQNRLTFDSAPTENSTFPVTSGGVYTALQSAGATYSLSISGSTITLTGTDGTTSSVSLPIYDGSVTEVWQGGVY